MSNQAPPQSGNPGEHQPPPYGQLPMGTPGGQGAPLHHPGMHPMMSGMPYPPYMMFSMGGPYYLPPPPPHGEGPPPEMQFQGPPMMPPPMMAPYGYPPMHPAMMQPPPLHHQMNPNVPTFVPASARPKSGADAPPTKVPAPSTPAPVEDKEETSGPAAPKPVSKRLAIIDPVTGEEISFQAKTSTPVAPPPSALVSAEIALGQGAPTPPMIKVSRKGSSASSESSSAVPVVPPPSSEPVTTATPSDQVITETPELEEEPRRVTNNRLGGMKLKNAPLPKPTPPPVAAQVSTTEGIKTLKRIKNVALEKKPTIELVPSVVTKPSKFKLVNKTLPATSASTSSSTTVSKPSVFPISREMFLRYMAPARPDRNAPSSINVFPSELLGLRTAPYGDPGLQLGRSGGRRGPAGGLQKTLSGTSANWRAGKQLGRTLSRQSSSRGVRSLVNQAVKPSERGFKIIDQSSLSEKDKLRRQVMSLLNKITVDSFGAITNQIAGIEISQPWQMDVVIGLIFDKAVVEHTFSEMYAEMCKKLRTTWPELTGVDQETGQSVPVTFTRAIIEKCQVEFDAIPDNLEPTEADMAKVRGNLEDLEMLMQKRKERILGNMKFIAQLFLMRILSSRVIRSVVEQLLFRVDEPEEHYIECVGILLHNIGGTLMDSESGRAYVSQFVDRLKDLIQRETYGKRIRFLMQDIIDAARAGWTGKHASSRLVSSVKSKEEVRKAALDEQQRQTGPPHSSRPRGPLPAARQQSSTTTTAYRPAAVLRRTSQTATAVPAAQESDWSDEEEEDEVSEYANEEEEEEEEGFTKMSVQSFNPEFPPVHSREESRGAPSDIAPTVLRSAFLNPTVPPLPGQQPSPEPSLSLPVKHQSPQPSVGPQGPGTVQNSPQVSSGVQAAPQPILQNSPPVSIGLQPAPLPPTLGPQSAPQPTISLQSGLQGPVGFGMVAPGELALMNANFDLQSKLERAVVRVKQLEREQAELLDRFEKAVTISANLKDIESKKNDYAEKFCDSEKMLKQAIARIEELEKRLNMKSEMLSQVRDKYFAERDRNDKQSAEIEVVKTAAELAKREVENQSHRASLREVQLSTARNLLETGSVCVAQPVQSVAASRVNFHDDELGMASTNNWRIVCGLSESISERGASSSGLSVTGWREWQLTNNLPSFPNDQVVTQHYKRIIQNGQTSFGGTILDDGIIRTSVSIQIGNDAAAISIVATNVSANLVQSVCVVNATRPCSSFEFVVEPNSAASYLKPGQHVSCSAELRLAGVFDSRSVSPTICVSYVRGGDLPKNHYIGLPIEVLKFVRPVKPDTDSLLAKWKEFESNEVCCKMNTSLLMFSDISQLAECGGSLMAQRGIDPNPRGLLLAGALPAGKHGSVKEVIVRVELTPSDFRGPPMLRVTCRSPSLTLSRSIFTSITNVLL